VTDWNNLSYSFLIAFSGHVAHIRSVFEFYLMKFIISLSFTFNFNVFLLTVLVLFMEVMDLSWLVFLSKTSTMKRDNILSVYTYIYESTYVRTSISPPDLASVFQGRPMNYDLWPTTYDIWPTTYHLWPTTNSLWPTTNNLWPTTNNLWPTTYDLRPTTNDPSPTIHRQRFN